MVKDEWLRSWGYTPGTEDAETAWSEKQAFDHREAPYVFGDISEYTSTLDGSQITSRSQHREHMRKHDVIEVGNEYMKPTAHNISVPSAGRDIKRHIDRVRAMPEREYRARIENLQNSARG
jgi:hypothetical protein